MTSNIPLETLHISSGPLQELKSRLNLVFKKDYMTRFKALQSIIDLSQTCDDFDEFWRVICPSFSLLFVSLAEDPSYVIRTKLFELHLPIATYMEGKLLRSNSSLLTEIFPYWLLLMYDIEKSVRNAARNAFSSFSAFINISSTEANIEDEFPFEKDIKLMLKLFKLSEESLVRIWGYIMNQLKSLIESSTWQHDDSLLERNICVALQLASLIQVKFPCFSGAFQAFSFFLDKTCINYLTNPRTSSILRKYYYQYACSLLACPTCMLLSNESLVFVCSCILRNNQDDYVDFFAILNHWALAKEEDRTFMLKSSNVVHDWLQSKWEGMPSSSLLRIIPELFDAFCTELEWWSLLVSSLSKVSIFSEHQQGDAAFCLAKCQFVFLQLSRRGLFSEEDVESIVILPFLSNLLSVKVCHFFDLLEHLCLIFQL